MVIEEKNNIDEDIEKNMQSNKDKFDSTDVQTETTNACKSMKSTDFLELKQNIGLSHSK